MTDDGLALPTASAADRARAVVAALAELDPTGASSAAVGILDAFVRTSLEKRTTEFHEEVARRLSVLARQVDALDEALAVAAYSTGVLAAARSASEEHLNYLANATARAMISADQRRNDHAMILLRLAADLTATHIRVLRILTNTAAGQVDAGAGGHFLARSLIARYEPELAVDEGLTGTILGDLERAGLNSDIFGLYDPGAKIKIDDEVVGTLGRELLEFVAPI